MIHISPLPTHDAMNTMDKGGKSKKAAAISRILPKIPQSETIQSLNLLYQSATFSAFRSTTSGTPLGEAIQRSIQLQTLAKKATLRLDTSIKRSLCKRCNVPLLPGLTCKIRCRTFASSSRAMQTKCNICSFQRRIIAPPSNSLNGNTVARRNRRKQKKKEQRLLREKLIKYKLAKRFVKATSHNFRTPPKSKEEAAALGLKWSQRMRRRAGKIKAQAIKEQEDKVKEVAKPTRKSRRRRNRTGLTSMVRYPDRIKEEEGWDSGWTSELGTSEKEAIKMLRGDHLLTSGVGRGGTTGTLHTG